MGSLQEHTEQLSYIVLISLLITPLKNCVPFQNVHGDSGEGKSKFDLIFPQISQIFPVVKIWFLWKYDSFYSDKDHRNKAGKQGQNNDKVNLTEFIKKFNSDLGMIFLVLYLFLSTIGNYTILLLYNHSLLVLSPQKILSWRSNLTSNFKSKKITISVRRGFLCNLLGMTCKFLKL